MRSSQPSPRSDTSRSGPSPTDGKCRDCAASLEVWRDRTARDRSIPSLVSGSVRGEGRRCIEALVRWPSWPLIEWRIDEEQWSNGHVTVVLILAAVAAFSTWTVRAVDLGTGLISGRRISPLRVS